MFDGVWLTFTHTLTTSFAVSNNDTEGIYCPLETDYKTAEFKGKRTSPKQNLNYMHSYTGMIYKMWFLYSYFGQERADILIVGISKMSRENTAAIFACGIDRSLTNTVVGHSVTMHHTTIIEAFRNITTQSQSLKRIICAWKSYCHTILNIVFFENRSEQLTQSL